MRKPRTKTLAFHDAILAVVAEYPRLTVRQLFYQLVVRGVVQKTEQEYERVGDAATQLRLSGRLPYRVIADGSRQRTQVLQFGSTAEALIAQMERRAQAED